MARRILFIEQISIVMSATVVLFYNKTYNGQKCTVIHDEDSFIFQYQYIVIKGTVSQDFLLLVFL
jgi:hypothetical protein